MKFCMHRGWFVSIKKNWLSDFSIKSTSLQECTNAMKHQSPHCHCFCLMKYFENRDNIFVSKFLCDMFTESEWLCVHDMAISISIKHFNSILFCYFNTDEIDSIHRTKGIVWPKFNTPIKNMSYKAKATVDVAAFQASHSLSLSHSHKRKNYQRSTIIKNTTQHKSWKRNPQSEVRQWSQENGFFVYVLIWESCRIFSCMRIYVFILFLS